MSYPSGPSTAAFSPHSLNGRIFNGRIQKHTDSRAKGGLGFGHLVIYVRLDILIITLTMIS